MAVDPILQSKLLKANGTTLVEPSRTQLNLNWCYINAPD